MEKADGKTSNWLFNIVMVWTIITSLFAWLPLVRIIGRPSEYFWGVLGLHGEGTDGPFWIFILATLYVGCMLYGSFRATNRVVAGALLVIWHLFLTVIVLYGVVTSGYEETIQGQGWNWKFPLWIVSLPAITFLILSIRLMQSKRWTNSFTVVKWHRTNTNYLLVSIALLLVAITLFRLGSNYNWVTALAILVTILQWLFLVESFKSGRPHVAEG